MENLYYKDQRELDELIESLLNAWNAGLHTKLESDLFECRDEREAAYLAAELVRIIPLEENKFDFICWLRGRLS